MILRLIQYAVVIALWEHRDMVWGFISDEATWQQAAYLLEQMKLPS